MEISKLRSIIRESISNNLKEIEDVAENAAMEAKLNAYTEAIEKVNKKIEMAESLEEMQELVDPTKLNELKKHLKTLEKSKEKLEKVKTKKNKGKEVVTDEPVEEAEIEEADKYNPENNWNDEEVDDPFDAGIAKNQPMDEVDLSDEEKEELRKKAETNDKEYNIMNESFLKMQKLAGVITESQYNEKKKLIENQLNEDNLEVKSIAKKLYSWLKQNGVAVSLATQNVNFKQIGIKDPKQQEATVYVFDDPSTKQTIIRVSLRGKESIVKDIENKLLTTYPGLEEFNKQQYKLYSGSMGMTAPQEVPGAINLTFDLKEKTTAKGGLVGNTNVKKKA